jgi:hypothetical protein
MGSLPEHNCKQASQTESTIDKMKGYDVDELLEWFEQNRPKTLTGKPRDKFKDADINGDSFLKHAGDKKFFLEDCKLPAATSERLADLASEIAGVVQKGKSTDHAPLLFSLH